MQLAETSEFDKVLGRASATLIVESSAGAASPRIYKIWPIK
jgi:hypothetical protein